MRSFEGQEARLVGAAAVAELNTNDKIRFRSAMLNLRLALRGAGAEQAARWMSRLARRRSGRWCETARELLPLLAGYRQGVFAGASLGGSLPGHKLERALRPLNEMLEMLETLAGVEINRTLLQKEENDDVDLWPSENQREGVTSSSGRRLWRR